MNVIKEIVLYPVETIAKYIWLRYTCVDSKNLQDTKGSAYDWDELSDNYAQNKHDDEDYKGLIVVRIVKRYPSFIFNCGFIQYTRKLKTEEINGMMQNKHDAEEDKGTCHLVKYKLKVYSFYKLNINFFNYTILLIIDLNT